MSATSTDPNWTPALKAPNGVVSNLVNPPSHGYITVIVMVTFLAVTTPFILVRMYTRHFVTRRIWWDDYTMLVAWVGLFGLFGILVETLKYGNGEDLWNVSKAHGAHFSKLFSNFEIVARISIFFTKLSILLLFLRVFVPRQTRKTKIFYAIWAVIWFNALYCVSLVLTVILQCVGKVETPGTTCIDTYALLVGASTINVFSDIVMVIIPLSAVWGLQLPVKRKLGLSVIFAVGCCAVAASIARLGWQIVKARDPNRTALLTKVALLAVAEQAIGMIVGCMPVLPAFFRHLSNQRSQGLTPQGRRGWKPGFGNSTLAYRNAKKMKKSKDSYLLSTDYKELDDLETGHNPNGDVKGTTTMIDGGCSRTSIPENTVEGLHGSLATSALVSKSVRVESYPRALETDHAPPQPAYFRN